MIAGRFPEGHGLVDGATGTRNCRRRSRVRAAFEAPRPMTQADVVARRAECDAAEASMREAGEWTNE
jgi:hypothetical protein